MKEKQKKIKVMFINHTSIIGGAERSLLDILTFINKSKFEPLFVCFEEGELVEKVREIEGVEVTVVPFPGELLRYNRDEKFISQIITPMYMIIPIVKLLIFTKKSNVNVVYTNSMKAHFIGVVTGKLSFKKVVWHVRDILDDGINKKLFIVFSQFTDDIICISKAVAKQFVSKKNVKVVYNGMLPIEEVPQNERV